MDSDHDIQNLNNSVDDRIIEVIWKNSGLC